MPIGLDPNASTAAANFFNSPYVHFLSNALDYVPRKDPSYRQLDATMQEERDRDGQRKGRRGIDGKAYRRIEIERRGDGPDRTLRQVED